MAGEEVLVISLVVAFLLAAYALSQVKYAFPRKSPVGGVQPVIREIKDVRTLTAQIEFERRNDLVSRTVYDGNARFIGTVKDLGYSQSGQAALLVETQGQEAWIPLSDVALTGDIILLNKGAVVTAKDGTVIF
jgi:sporulation protein YlmC with PRC-barrel domain